MNRSPLLCLMFLTSFLCSICFGRQNLAQPKLQNRNFFGAPKKAPFLRNNKPAHPMMMGRPPPPGGMPMHGHPLPPGMPPPQPNGLGKHQLMAHPHQGFKQSPPPGNMMPNMPPPNGHPLPFQGHPQQRPPQGQPPGPPLQHPMQHPPPHGQRIPRPYPQVINNNPGQRILPPPQPQPQPPPQPQPQPQPQHQPTNGQHPPFSIPNSNQPGQWQPHPGGPPQQHAGAPGPPQHPAGMPGPPHMAPPMQFPPPGQPGNGQPQSNTQSANAPASPQPTSAAPVSTESPTTTTLEPITESDRYFDRDSDLFFENDAISLDQQQFLDSEPSDNIVFAQTSNSPTDQPWTPLVFPSDRDDFSSNSQENSQSHIVLAQFNSSEMSGEEMLPTSQPLIGPFRGHHRGSNRRQGGPLTKYYYEPPGKIEHIKRGLYGILFGRKGPPHNRMDRGPPPPVRRRDPSPGNRRQQIKLPEELSCEIFTNDVCLDTGDYPYKDIMIDLMQNPGRVSDMYVELPNITEHGLMDGVSAADEMTYDFDHYYGKTSHSHRDYGSDGGYVCPSEVAYAQPRRGRRADGEWRFIVNVPGFTQSLRVERCLKPRTKCSYVSPHLDSQCVQLHSLQRLLVWTRKRGVHIDLLKIPTACTCHIASSHTHTKRNVTDISSDIAVSMTDEDTVAEAQRLVTTQTETEQPVTEAHRAHKASSAHQDRPIVHAPPGKVRKYSKHKKPRQKEESLETAEDDVESSSGREPVVEYAAEGTTSDNNEDFGSKKNYNHHPTSHFFQPWN